MASGEYTSIDRWSTEVILLDNELTAVSGPWVAVNLLHNLCNFTVSRANPKDTTTQLTLPVTNIEIQGTDGDTTPNASFDGVTIGVLTSSILSLTNSGFAYKFYRAKHLGVNPALQVIGKFTRA